MVGAAVAHSAATTAITEPNIASSSETAYI
jgi:hypothetical protein